MNVAIIQISYQKGLQNAGILGTPPGTKETALRNVGNGTAKLTRLRHTGHHVKFNIYVNHSVAFV